MLLSKLLLTCLCFSLSNTQLIYINVCTDNNCNTNCISWVATNNKCQPCKTNEPCSRTNPSSITTYNSFSIYSDATCTTQVPNTYTMPIVLNNNCNQLFLEGNQFQDGSYKAYDLSALIGIIMSVIIILIIIICCIIYRYCKCCKKIQPSFETQPAIIIADENRMHPTQFPQYGYQIQNQPIPSAPPAPMYYPSSGFQPSAPPAPMYYPTPNSHPPTFI